MHTSIFHKFRSLKILGRLDFTSDGFRLPPRSLLLNTEVNNTHPPPPTALPDPPSPLWKIWRNRGGRLQRAAEETSAVFFFSVFFGLKHWMEHKNENTATSCSKKSKKIIPLKAKVTFPVIAVESRCLKTHCSGSLPFVMSQGKTVVPCQVLALSSETTVLDFFFPNVAGPAMCQHQCLIMGGGGCN